MITSQISFKTSMVHLDSLRIYYLEVPAVIVTKLGGISKQRLICTTKSVSWQCGLVALGKGKGYISLNKKLIKQLDIKEGDTVTASLKKDESKYGMEMPEELKELLNQDKEGNKRYHAIVPGKQRYIIYYIQQVKSSQLLVERAIMLIENLKKLPKGKESYKGLFGISSH